MLWLPMLALAAFVAGSAVGSVGMQPPHTQGLGVESWSCSCKTLA